MKNWPSDTITKQRGRKKEVPVLPGWNYFEATTNLFIHCLLCSDKDEASHQFCRRADTASHLRRWLAKSVFVFSGAYVIAPSV
jgi:hypothetical protein